MDIINTMSRPESTINEFIYNMPKIELHAHLNGSLNVTSILELAEMLYGANTLEFLELSKKFVDFDGVGLAECFRKFQFVHDLTLTRSGLELATLLVIRDFALDSVIYLELRTTPKTNEHMTKREYLECVLETIEKAKEIYTNLRVHLIPSIDRSKEVSAAEETLQLILDLRRVYPDTIVGIDFSGNPYCGNFKDFIPVLKSARENDLKLALHCAETDNQVEIAEMLNFGMDRCGHGTFLSNTQLQHIAQAKVPIECCLTSNVKCNTVPSYDDHHFKKIFDAKDAVVLCTDDCGVFDSTLTQEFVLATKTFGLNKKDLYRLTMNALEHAFIDNNEKQKKREIIVRYFDCINFS